MVVRRARHPLVFAALCVGTLALGCDQGPTLSKTGGLADPRMAIATPQPIDPHKLSASERLNLNQLVSPEVDSVETSHLEALLTPQTKPAISVAASRALTQRGAGEATIGALIAHPDTDAQVRVNLIKHLSGRSSPPAIQALETSFDKLSVSHQVEMLQILGHAKNPAHKPLLDRAAASTDVELRAAAQRALEKFSAPSSTK